MTHYQDNEELKIIQFDKENSDYTDSFLYLFASLQTYSKSYIYLSLILRNGQEDVG